MADGARVFGVLAIDGGGIRGIIPATVLAWLERYLGRPTAQIFDLIVGTSTGGLLSLGLTYTGRGTAPAYSAQSLLEMYCLPANDARIFTPTLSWNPPVPGTPVPWELAALNPKYQGAGVQAFLESQFGAARLSQAAAAVACTTYDTRNLTPLIFRSWEARICPDRDFLCVDVGRATSAAPLYFPPASISNLPKTFSTVCVDGGVCWNDPAMIAYVEARALLVSRGEDPAAYTFWVVSLGTGAPTIAIDPGDGGIWGWVLSGALLNVLTDTVPQAVDVEAQTLLTRPTSNAYYARLQPPLDDPPTYDCSPDLDNWTAANVAALQEAGQAAIGEGKDALDAYATARGL